MKIPLYAYIQSDKLHIRNLLNTFGYIVISDYFTEAEVLLFRSSLDQAFVLKYGHTPSHEKFFKTWVVENDKTLFEELFGQTEPLAKNEEKRRGGGMRGYLDLVESLFGRNCFYGFSSAETFSKGTPWHRDCFISSPVYKVASYFYNSDTSNSLCVFPGSHNSPDLYSANLSLFCGWPEAGGARRGFFPDFAYEGRRLLSDFPDPSSPLELPYQVLTYGPRDLVIFDTRLIHATPESSGNALRYMLYTVWYVNPEDINKDSSFLAYEKRKYLMQDQIFKLREIEGGHEGGLFYPEKLYSSNDSMKRKLGLMSRINEDFKPSPTMNMQSAMMKHIDFLKSNYPQTTNISLL